MTELYLYQTLHLCRREIRLLDRHVALLDEASRQLFGAPYAPDPQRLARRIAALADAERYPSDLSSFVRLELTADGRERLLPGGVSLYEGYALRSLAPDAAVVRYDMPLTEAPTSAREAVALLARQQAERAGCPVAVQCTADGRLAAADGAPLFAVRDDRLRSSSAVRCVAHGLVLRAAAAAGFPIDREPLRIDDLPRCDELFYADHRGITALAHCDGLPLMDIAAGKIAAAMEALFRRA